MDIKNSERHEGLLRLVRELPKKMIKLHGIDNTTEFLLHDLCHEKCFDINKAAYLVDNPSFNCLKGVAGFEKNNNIYSKDHWQSPEEFSDHMKKSTFNQKVRNVYGCSCSSKENNLDSSLNNISSKLNFENPNFLTWDMKYNNVGILLFEKTNVDKYQNEVLKDVVHFFGFCPVF